MENEAVMAVWEEDHWVPYGIGYKVDYENAKNCFWPKWIKINELKSPRFYSGQKIKFKWSEGYKTGIVTEVSLFWTSFYYGMEDRMKDIQVCYEVKCIGHSHMFYDKNEKYEAEVIL